MAKIIQIGDKVEFKPKAQETMERITYYRNKRELFTCWSYGLIEGDLEVKEIDNDGDINVTNGSSSQWVYKEMIRKAK